LLAARPSTFAWKSEAPISSLRTTPESLKLRVWSKSDANRKCFFATVVVPK